MSGEDFGEGFSEPGQYLLVGLGAGEGPALFFGEREELLGKLGVVGLLFRPSVAFEDATVTFHETRLGHDLPGETGLARHYLSGLEGPCEGACVNTGDLFVLQGPARLGLSRSPGLSRSVLTERKGNAWRRLPANRSLRPLRC